MPTPKLVGTEIKDIDMISLLPPDEGEIDQYYGRIGNGKTYAATVDVIEDLKRGKIVYTNWKIKWDGFDERSSKWRLFLGVVGLKKDFFYFPPENLHFFQIDENFTEWISSVNDCKVYIDEGHIAFDSYEMAKMKIEKRTAVLHTRHFDRSIIIISQRPSAIHVTLRANVNRFYKCEKTMDMKIFGLHLQRFKKTEFQDVKENDIPDEKKKVKIDKETGEHIETDDYEFAISTKSYWGKKSVFEKYDTKYRREGLPTSQPNYAQLYFLRWVDRIKLLFKF